MGDVTLFRDLGSQLRVEPGAARAALQNDVGDLYVDFQGVGGQRLAELPGRALPDPGRRDLSPVRQGLRERPFVSNVVAAPGGGTRACASTARAVGESLGRFGYVASVSNGDTPFNVDTDSRQAAHAEALLRAAGTGCTSAPARCAPARSATTPQPASGALWLGEAWARAFGAGTTVPNFQNGVAVADGPNRLRETWFVGGDAILDFEDRAHIWGAYGQYAIDSQGGSFYDRTLQYWIAELILHGAWLGESFRPFYAGFRGAVARHHRLATTAICSTSAAPARSATTCTS